MKKTIPYAALVLTLALPGCADMQRTFAAIGAIGCGAAAAAFGGGSSSARAGRGVAAAGACGLIGSAIGRSLDERDRQRMELATAQALQRRLPPQYYRPGFQAASYQTAGGYGAALPSGSSNSRSDTTPAAATRTGHFPGLAPVRGAQWVSDHSGATGSVEVVSAEKPKDDRGECRNVVQTVRQSGEAPVSETSKFCESRPGANDWMKI